MNELEQFKNITESSFTNIKYLPFEGAFSNYSVIVFGRTDTAINWAQKFLKAGFITATEFKSDEIPEVLKPYEFNLRYKPADFRSGDILGDDLIVAIATGDTERDQIIASIVHGYGVQLIMSETPCRYSNIRFPEDKTKIEKKPVDSNSTENKPVIKLGVFEDEQNSDSMKSAITELEKNFPNFQFKVINLKPYDVRKYDLDFGSYENSTHAKANQNFDRGYNALFKEDVDLILVDAETAPNFYMPDIEYWPTLIKRRPNEIITISPAEKGFNGITDWPDKQKVFYQKNAFTDEIQSILNQYNMDNQESKYPDFWKLKSFKRLKEIYEKNPDAVIVTSFSEFLEDLDYSLECFETFNLKLGFLSLAPVPLQNLKIGISRKDNSSKALEMLNTAAQKINQEQSQMFIFENFYRNRLDPYYGRFLDFEFSGGFNKKYDGKFTFDGYFRNKHNRYLRCGGKEFDSMEEAIAEMFIFIHEAIVLW